MGHQSHAAWRAKAILAQLKTRGRETDGKSPAVRFVQPLGCIISGSVQATGRYTSEGSGARMRKHIIIEGALWSLAITAGVLWSIQSEDPHMSLPDQESLGRTQNQLRAIERPLVMIHQAPDGRIMTHLRTAPNANSPKALGLTICEFVRYVAREFKVNENDVWEWVDEERRKPTTDLRSPS
jgi:hypothetical protein